VRLFASPPPTTHYDVRRTNVLFHAYITYTRIKIHDWLSIVITSFVFQKAKFSLASTLSSFNFYSHIKFAISQLAPSNQCILGLQEHSTTQIIFALFYDLGGGVMIK
jgi:hypothetical protein